MRKISTGTFHSTWTIFLLSLFVQSFSFAQIVIKDTIEISPNHTIHPQSMLSGEMIIEIGWFGQLPTPIHLRVLDGNYDYLGWNPYSESADGDYSEVMVGPNSGVSRLKIPSAPTGNYDIMAIVDTSQEGGYRTMYAEIYTGDDTTRVHFYDYFEPLVGTRFHIGDAGWYYGLPCFSNDLTMAVSQIGYVQQPNFYSTFATATIQDGCGMQRDSGNMYIRAEILDGAQWGDLVDYNTGKSGEVIDSIPLYGDSAAVYYRP